MSKSITIAMSGGTVQTLNSGKFTLYAFKAVQAFPNNGVPMVWQALTHFKQSNTITWDETYQAYTTNSSVSAGSQIKPLFSTNIAMGQTLQIDGSGKGTVINGSDGVISLTSQQSVSLAGGVTQSAAAISVFPILGNTVQITPIDQVLLVMSNVDAKVGTTALQTSGNGLLVDLSNSSSAAVSYDATSGWSGAGTNVPANSSTVQFLIQRQAD